MVRSKQTWRSLSQRAGHGRRDIKMVDGVWVKTIPAVGAVSTSAHANRNNIVAGGSFLFEDAHVEWIRFDFLD